MKVHIDIIGYMTTLTNGEKAAEVTLPGASAPVGEVLAELAKRYGDSFNLMIDQKDRVIVDAVAMIDGKIAAYDTPVYDGERVVLTMMMDGG